jgi:hypothetical protein
METTEAEGSAAEGSAEVDLEEDSVAAGSGAVGSVEVEREAVERVAEMVVELAEANWVEGVAEGMWVVATVAAALMAGHLVVEGSVVEGLVVGLAAVALAAAGLVVVLARVTWEEARSAEGLAVALAVERVAAGLGDGQGGEVDLPGFLPQGRWRALRYKRSRPRCCVG